MEEITALRAIKPLPPNPQFSIRKARLHELPSIVDLRIKVFFPEIIDTYALHDTILSNLRERVKKGSIVLIATLDRATVDSALPSSSSTSSSPCTVLDIESASFMSHWEYEILERLKESAIFESALLGTLEISPTDFEGTAMEEIGGKRKLYTADLAIRADARRRGIATKLLKSVETYAREHDFQEVYLNVEIDNDNAKMLYQKNKYREIPRNDWVIGFTQTRLVKPSESYVMYAKTMELTQDSSNSQ